MSKPFYQKTPGLRFECTDCGRCCTRPGPVYFSDEEVAAAAAHLGLSLRAFRKRYSPQTVDDLQEIDPGGDRPCPFYDPERACTIYPARPVQCRTWPFWPEVVRRARSWRKAASECEGMDRGPIHTVGEIDRELQKSVDAGLPEGDPW